MPINNPANIGNVTVSPDRANTITQISNNLSTSSSNAILANSNRKGLTIFNKLSTTLYVDNVDTVSNSDFMFKLESGAFYEMPEPIYTGTFWMVLATGTGSVEIRELT